MDQKLKDLTLRTADYLYAENKECPLVSGIHTEQGDEESTNLIIALSDAFNKDHSGRENALADHTLTLLSLAYLYTRAVRPTNDATDNYSIPLCDDLAVLVRHYTFMVFGSQIQERVIYAKNLIKRIDDMQYGLCLIFRDTIKENVAITPDIIAIRNTLRTVMVEIRTIASDVVKFES